VSHTACNKGCDHAWLSLGLATSGFATRVVAIDAKAFPLSLAERNLRPYRRERELQPRERASFAPVDLRLGCGLSPLSPGEVGTAVIAGMGARSICEAALGEGIADGLGVSTLVLNPPARDAPRLRAALLKNGWAVRDEAMVLDRGWLHIVVKAERATAEGHRAPMDAADALLGPVLRVRDRADAVFQAFLRMRLESVRRRRGLLPVSATYKGGDAGDLDALLEEERILCAHIDS